MMIRVEQEGEDFYCCLKETEEEAGLKNSKGNVNDPVTFYLHEPGAPPSHSSFPR